MAADQLIDFEGDTKNSVNLPDTSMARGRFSLNVFQLQCPECIKYRPRADIGNGCQRYRFGEQEP